MNSLRFLHIRSYSVAAMALFAVLGFARPSSASGFALCPSATADRSGINATFTSNVAGVSGVCGNNTGVRMDIPASTDYARIAWHAGDAGYPAPLTIGNLSSMTADVTFSGADQPFFMLSFVDASGGLGQSNASHQILFIEFQPVTIIGNTMTVDRNVTLFNMFDNVDGVYLQGGQQTVNTLNGWVALHPFLSGIALDQIRIGIGLSGGNTGAESLTIRSLTGNTADAAVPEPATLFLLGSGLTAVAAIRRRKARA